MVVIEFNGVELDFCPACEGCWLDEGELGLVVAGKTELPADWTRWASRASRRRCPHCGRRMRTGPLPGTDVEAEACGHRHGLWLDRGELQQIMKSPGAAAPVAALARHCGTIFASADKTKKENAP